MPTPKCPKCNIKMEDVGGDDYADMTEGQQADYDAGFNHLFECSECRESLVYEHQVPMPDIDDDDWDTPEEYSDELLEMLEKYNENKINECIEKEFYIEAIVDLHRHIGEQLRFLIIKQIKGITNIPLDSTNERFNELVPLLKRMDDDPLIRMAFVYERIGKQDKDKLLELNKTRNKFVHAFNKKEREEIFSNKGQLKGLLESCIEIEKKLADLIWRYKQ
jgi:hypothetical protein